MSVSVNSNAVKSFQSLTVSEALLQKVVEAVRAGEKEARSTGDIQSFEVFYRGFRENITIGRLYVIPASVCNNKDENKFPTALLFGSLVSVFGGEELGDLIEHRIGSTEFDEYSQMDFDSIKEKIFTGPDGETASLVLFAPTWWNKREYITFHYTDDVAKLKNNLRHQVFAAYYDPRLSSAFEALMTNVNTTKVDVTDITPKIPFPFLAENVLKQFPDLQKQATNRKKIFLTHRNADAVTQEVLDPQELDVFQSLDQAISEALMPGVETVEEASEPGSGGFNAPDPSNEVPRVASGNGWMAKIRDKNGKERTQPVKGDHDYKSAEKKVSLKPGESIVSMTVASAKDEAPLAAHEAPFSNVGPGAAAHDKQKDLVPAMKDNVELRAGQPPIGIAIDENGVPRNKTEEEMGKSLDKSASADAFTPTNKKDKIHPGNLRDADVSAAIDEKKWGTATIPLNFGKRQGGIPTVKTAAANYIADHIAMEIDDSYEAMSPKAKQARIANENTLAKNRYKQADVPLDIESIWNEITEDMGPAPVIEIPGEGQEPGDGGGSEDGGGDDRPKDGRPRKSDIGKLPESFTTNKPEKEKSMSDSEAESQEDSTPKPEAHQPQHEEEPSKDDEPKETSNEEPKENEGEGEDEKPWRVSSSMEDFVKEAVSDLEREQEDSKSEDDDWFEEPDLDENGEPFEDHEAAAPALAPAPELAPQADPAAPRPAAHRGLNGYFDFSTFPDTEQARCTLCNESIDIPFASNAASTFAPLAQHMMQSHEEEYKHRFASKKKADTADNPYNMQDGSGAPTDKKNVEKPDTSGPEIKNTASKKKADVVQPDITEAKSKVVSPDTVDPSIQQPTESVEQAAKQGAEDEEDEPEGAYHPGEEESDEEMARRQAADVSGDMSEAKGELDHGAKSELADNSKATQTVNPEHFAAGYIDEAIPVGSTPELDDAIDIEQQAEERKRLRGFEKIMLGEPDEFNPDDTYSLSPEATRRRTPTMDEQDARMTMDEQEPRMSRKRADTVVDTGHGMSIHEEPEENNQSSSVNLPLGSGAPVEEGIAEAAPLAVMAAAGDDQPEERSFDFGMGDLADIVIAVEEDN